MNKYYTITLTPGTTSPGPYTIYLNGNPPAVIPLRYPELTLAQNIDIDILLAGVTVEVPDNTTSIVVYNTYCGSPLSLIPPTISTYSDFCLSVSAPKKGGTNVSNTHFIYNGLDSNNKPTWIDENELNPNSTINWVGNQWLLSTTIYGNSMFSTSELTPSVTFPSFWQGTSAGPGSLVLSSIDVNEGNCGIVRKQLSPVSVNQPTCLCDGSIIFNVTLDNPPFNYSIDNGVTYSSSPIFTELCSGIYSISVVDSLGDVYSNSVTLNNPEQSITYEISLNTTNTTPVINNVSIVNSYETIIIINPPLPDGATVTFDIIHNNSFYSSPNSGTSILTTSTILYKNNSQVILTNTSNSKNQSINTNAGCQTEYVYQLNIDDVWGSLTITNNDTITISTSSRVDKTTSGECVVGYSTDSFSISNPVISGCDCCSIKIN